jgi:hypothetical protein
LLVSGPTLAARCVEKGGKKVHVLEADDISRSTAARNTTSIEKYIEIASLACLRENKTL